MIDPDTMIASCPECGQLVDTHERLEDAEKRAYRWHKLAGKLQNELNEIKDQTPRAEVVHNSAAGWPWWEVRINGVSVKTCRLRTEAQDLADMVNNAMYLGPRTPSSAETPPPQVKHLVVVSDKDSGDECLYINGQAWESTGECTVYACDIDEAAGRQPVLFDRWTAIDVPDAWPTKLVDLTFADGEGPRTPSSVQPADGTTEKSSSNAGPAFECRGRSIYFMRPMGHHPPHESQCLEATGETTDLFGNTEYFAQFVARLLSEAWAQAAERGETTPAPEARESEASHE